MLNDDFYLPRPQAAFTPARASTGGVEVAGAQYTAPQVGNVRPFVGQNVLTVKVGRLQVPIATEGFHSP